MISIVMSDWPRYTGALMRLHHTGAVRTASLLIFTGLTFLTPQMLSQSAIPQWAREHTDQWYAAIQAGNATQIGKFYRADGEVISPKQTLRGRAAIEMFHRDNFEKTRYQCTWKIEGVSALDRLAAIWGIDRCVETPKAGGSAETIRSRWLSIYERQADGSWLITRDSYDILR